MEEVALAVEVALAQGVAEEVALAQVVAVEVALAQVVAQGVVALAQGMAAFDATCLAVWLHARAGEMLARQGRRLAAGDLPCAIRQLLEELCPCLK